MREILFRGKRLDTGEWVYGNYSFADCFTKHQHYISQNKAFEHAVDPSTVGQFTGLSDRKGKRIFEGDIVSTGKERRVVRFRNGAFELLRRVSAVTMYDLVGTDVEYEIIGTIHDKEKQNEGK